MCRICGYFSVDVPLQELRRAARMQRHGGPDEHSVTRGTGWGFAVDRLAIVDVDAGQQPYELDGMVKVVLNGEIYNHDALRRQLRGKGYTFTDRCDGSILPALYAEYGVDFADHLDGMYAIAVIDMRTEPRLVLITDDLGMKSLYYQWDVASGELHFASELPALLAFEGVDATPSMHALDAYLSTRTPFGEDTVFKHIRALAPATTAVLTRREGLRITRRAPPQRSPTRTDLEWSGLELRALLQLEVGYMLQGDVAVAAILSGGLDSSLTTMLAAEIDPGVHTFNIAYRGAWPHDERHFALAVAQRAGTNHHQVELDPAAIPDVLADVVRHMGQPNADPITASSYVLFEAVRAAGFKVALSGDGADELFAGYDRIRAAMAVAPGGRWIPDYVDSLAAIPRSLREALYTPDYRCYLAEQGSTADRIADRLAASTKPRLDALTELEVGERLPSYHLRRVDHMSMAHGVEVRPVFCQPRVVELARSLAPHLRVSGNEVKRVLYRAADGLLPASILDRPKQPFTLPIAAMLRPGQPLFAYVQEVLAVANLRTHALLEPAVVSRLMAEQSTRPSGRSALALWSLLVFELWLASAPRGAACGGGGMNGYIAYALGSPCPTLVLDASQLPTGHDNLIPALARARAELVATGHEKVLKFALISRALDPRFDLDYTFVQCLPGKPDRFDTRGSCGHSILCSIMVARHLQWLGRLAPETKVRVNVVNNDDSVVCEVEEAAWPHAGFTAYFMSTATARLGDALPIREPVTAIPFEDGRVPVSIASVANLYAFVDAATLGIRSQEELFSGDPQLYDRAAALRVAVTERVGLPSGGAFPSWRCSVSTSQAAWPYARSASRHGTRRSRSRVPSAWGSRPRSSTPSPTSWPAAREPRRAP